MGDFLNPLNSIINNTEKIRESRGIDPEQKRHQEKKKNKDRNKKTNNESKGENLPIKVEFYDKKEKKKQIGGENGHKIDFKV